MTSVALAWCLYCQLYFSICSIISIINFEQVNEVTKIVAQWENDSLSSFKVFPHYCRRLPHTKKKIKLHLQANSDLLFLLYAFSHQNYNQ